MSIQPIINRFFERIEGLRQHEINHLDAFAKAVQSDPEITGVSVYEDVVTRRWRVDAYDYVLKAQPEVKCINAFELLLEGLTRDMIAHTAQYDPAVSDPPSYWKAIGKVHQDLTMAVARAREAQRTLDVASSVRA